MIDASRGWTVARLAGIPVRVHPTFLFLVAFVALGWMGTPLAGGIWVALIFSSVVVHELAHALVARRRGLKVIDIVLLPIGGVSEIEELPSRPRDELVVAAAGPVTSLVVGGLTLSLAALVVGDVSPTLSVGPLLVRLGWANVLLGVFNLVPALPMDGGRVLRAALAIRVGVPAATEQAAAISRGLAVAMGTIGILVLPWLLVIAVFVWFSGRTEEAAVLVHERLAPLRVCDVMVPLVGAITPPGPVEVVATAPLEDALRTMIEASAQLATVVDADGAIVGVLLLQSVAEKLRGDEPRAA